MVGELAECTERAERLRVLLWASPWASDPERAMGELTEGDRASLAGLDPEDLALVNACHELEADLRARAFAAIERLGAAINTAPDPEAPLEDRVRVGPRDHASPRLVCGEGPPQGFGCVGCCSVR
jgi:hypothetical protein